MKWLRRIRFVCLCGSPLLLAFAWYLGFIPIAEGPARSGLRHALDIRMLPSSTTVISSGSDMWTDYIFHAEVTIEPGELQELLSGREFSHDPKHPFLGQNTHASLIDGYVGFPIHEYWTWSGEPMEPKLGDYGPRCDVYVDASGSRVLVNYGAD